MTQAKCQRQQSAEKSSGRFGEVEQRQIKSSQSSSTTEILLPLTIIHLSARGFATWSTSVTTGAWIETHQSKTKAVSNGDGVVKQARMRLYRNHNIR